MMKKILLLGGSAQQIIAIETAKRLGYYTVLCDFLPDNPGQYHADKFYMISTTDKDSVMEIAVKENIDGILAYASDPAAPTAAYIAEKLNLPTNPYESVETLCNKDKFRKFLKKHNFNTPISKGYSDKKIDTSIFELPVIIKPVDSSGSKGVTVLKKWDELENALEYAFSYSRSHRIIVEEYIEKKHDYLVGGDIFVLNGKIVLWGLLNCHRDYNVNPLVPIGKSYPLLLDDVDVRSIKETLQRMVECLGMRYGSINVELVIDKNGRVWPIDIGPRAGGNMIPDLLGIIFETDVVEMAVLAAMGKKVKLSIHERKCYYATHNIHSASDGIYENIVFKDSIKGNIIETHIYKKQGDAVRRFANAADALGIIFMKFDNQEEMIEKLQNINNEVTIVLNEDCKITNNEA